MVAEILHACTLVCRAWHNRARLLDPGRPSIETTNYAEKEFSLSSTEGITAPYPAKPTSASCVISKSEHVTYVRLTDPDLATEHLLTMIGLRAHAKYGRESTDRLLRAGS